jgi:hypothetical protein
MDSQAIDFLNDVSPKKGRRSFKLFFGTLVGFAIALYLIPTESSREKIPITKRQSVQKPRTFIPVWTWKTLLSGVEEELSPLIANVRFQGEGLRKNRAVAGVENRAPNGSIQSAQSGGTNGA